MSTKQRVQRLTLPSGNTKQRKQVPVDLYYSPNAEVSLIIITNMAQTQHVSSMFTVQGMREFVCSRLTQAAQEILGAFENRAREYELELERQRRLLAIAYSQAGPAGPADPDIKVEHLDTSVSAISCVSEHISNPNSSQNADGAESSPPSPQRPTERSQSPAPAPDPVTVPINAPSGPSRCRHGYKLPESRNPSNKDLDKQSDASAAVEIIEIDDISPASSDVEVVPDNDERRASRDVEDASRKSKGLAGESQIQKSCTKSPPTRLSLPIRHNENAVDVSTECPERHVTEGAPTKAGKANKTNGKSAHGKSKSEKSHKTKQDRTTAVQKHTDKETVPEISNENGKSHGRGHTSEKVFQCEVCGRAFSNNWNLKRHEVIHYRPKPHKCPDCGKGFHKFWNMAAHQDKHRQRQQAGQGPGRDTTEMS